MPFYNDNMKKLPNKLLKDLEKRRKIEEDILRIKKDLKKLDKQIDLFIEKAGK